MISAVHIDWHEWDGTGIEVCVVLDDAFRMVLAGGELKKINTHNSIEIINQLVDSYWWLCPMSELIMEQSLELIESTMKAAGTANSNTISA